jgi:type IV secretory pathway VirB4 component
MSTQNSTQEHLPIAGIHDGVVIMNDGSLRAVMRVEPVNFELKSDQEQNAIIATYQAFLNSLDTSIQIVIQSKRLDLERYLKKLELQTASITNPLLRLQSEDYIGFVRRLISVANIMAKRFYVIVSYSPLPTNPKQGFQSFFAKKPTGPLMNDDQFNRYRTELFSRANSVAGGLMQVGTRVTALETQQLIELFYSTYNPEIAAEERVSDSSAIATSIVTSNDQPEEEVPQ